LGAFWRVKNSAKSVPFKTIRELPDGSELVMLHESGGMRTRRRRETGNPHAERLPGTIARLVTFTVTVTAQAHSGRVKTTQIRVLTTFLNQQAYPAREIAVLCAERWQIEISFLHLKKTVRGPAGPLRGQSPELARQEAWALLLIHNIAPPPAGTPANLRKNHSRTPDRANRGSHLHHRHHKVESPEMGHTSNNLRAAAVTRTCRTRIQARRLTVNVSLIE
jgi:Transposase DDE domain